MILKIAVEAGRDASHALTLMCTMGLAMAALRWRQAVRRDYLLSFALGMLGMFLGQMPVWFSGPTGWGNDPVPVIVAGIARWTQFVSAVLFVRAALRDYCGPWVWWSVTAATLLIALVI